MVQQHNHHLKNEMFITITQVQCKMLSYPITGLDRPLQIWEVEAHSISKQSSHEVGKAVSPMHRPPLNPRKYPWHSFPLEAESTPWPKCGWKDQVNEKSNDPISNWTHNLPACSIVPQPTAPPYTPKYHVLSWKYQGKWHWNVSLVKHDTTHLVTCSLFLVTAAIARAHFYRTIGPCPTICTYTVPTTTNMVIRTIFRAAQNFVTGIETFRHISLFVIYCQYT